MTASLGCRAGAPGAGTPAGVEEVKAKERARLASAALPPSWDRVHKASKPSPGDVKAGVFGSTRSDRPRPVCKCFPSMAVSGCEYTKLLISQIKHPEIPAYMHWCLTLFHCMHFAL